MFGGGATHDGHLTPTNNVYIFSVTHNTIVSYYYMYVHVRYTCVLSYISFLIFPTIITYYCKIRNKLSIN